MEEQRGRVPPKNPSGLVDTMETINSFCYSSCNAYDMSTVTQGCLFSTVHGIFDLQALNHQN